MIVEDVKPAEDVENISKASLSHQIATHLKSNSSAECINYMNEEFFLATIQDALCGTGNTA